MSSLAVGKMRRLQQCATDRGVFAVIAMDHRGSLRRMLDPKHPDAVPGSTLVTFKRKVVTALAPVASAVLLDPEYGATQMITAGALPRATGLIVALERTGYAGDSTARVGELVLGWDPQRVGRIGATGAKLLVYYHPDASTAPQAEALVQGVAASCQDAHVPLFLEPISYSPDSARRRLLPQERRRVVIETARRLTSIPGVDVLKAEFPLDVTAVTDEAEWLVACRELSEASLVPWVLLSAGVDFETYLRQVAVAARAGASGVAVGRAVWREAAELPSEEQDTFLTTVARERMARVTSLCQALACPWTEIPPKTR